MRSRCLVHVRDSGSPGHGFKAQALGHQVAQFPTSAPETLAPFPGLESVLLLLGGSVLGHGVLGPHFENSDREPAFRPHRPCLRLLPAASRSSR